MDNNYDAMQDMETASAEISAGKLISLATKKQYHRLARKIGKLEATIAELSSNEASMHGEMVSDKRYLAIYRRIIADMCELLDTDYKHVEAKAREVVDAVATWKSVFDATESKDYEAMSGLDLTQMDNVGDTLISCADKIMSGELDVRVMPDVIYGLHHFDIWGDYRGIVEDMKLEFIVFRAYNEAKPNSTTTAYERLSSFSPVAKLLNSGDTASALRIIGLNLMDEHSGIIAVSFELRNRIVGAVRENTMNLDLARRIKS